MLSTDLTESIEEFIKEMFLKYRVGRLRLSAKWLAKNLSDSLNWQVTEMDARQYLKRLGLEPAYPTRIRIPIDADYAQVDAQGHPEITAYHCETSRPYTLLIQDWLTEEELLVFAGPITEAM